MHGAAPHRNQSRDWIDITPAGAHVEGSEPSQGYRQQETKQCSQVSHLDGLKHGRKIVVVHDVLEVGGIVAVREQIADAPEHPKKTFQRNVQVLDRVGKKDEH